MGKISNTPSTTPKIVIAVPAGENFICFPNLIWSEGINSNDTGKFKMLLVAIMAQA
jgi:hypothetical protein